MKTTQLRPSALSILLLLLMLPPLQTNAGNTDGFLKQLHTFRVSNYMALEAYYRFIGSGSEDTLNEITAGINSANASMAAVAQSASGAAISQHVTKLDGEFGQFKSLMRDNIDVVRDTGYPDLRLASDLANQGQVMNEMATELYLTAQENRQAETQPRVEAARTGAVKIAQMMAKYSVRTNSSVAQTFQGSATDKPLDEQAREFDTLLAEMRKGNNSDELNTLWDDLASKWQFIRGSYVNYNENNVGFVIERYSKRILENLTTAVALLQQHS